MIDEVSDSLEAFLKQPGLPPPLRDAAIRFDRPTDPYALEQTTVNVFLFDVRENRALRSNENTVRQVGGQSVAEPPAFRANCQYLVTAWPVGGADLAKQEQRLLAQVLQLIAGAPEIPPAFLTPQLQLQEPALPMTLVPPDDSRDPADFWAAIGNRLKPSLVVSVTVSLRAFDTATYPTVVTREMRIRTRAGAALEAPAFLIGGTVVDAGSVPVALAGVSIVGRGRSTLTDAQGRFAFSALQAGHFVLRVTAGGATKEQPIVIPATAPGGYDVQLP